jgi:hypothetical protein
VKTGTAEGGGESARAERQQKLLANGFIDVIEIQCGLAFITKQFQNGRPPFFGHFDPRVLEMDHVHLQCLHKKVLVVPTAGTGQRHARLLFRSQLRTPYISILGDASGPRNAEKREFRKLNYLNQRLAGVSYHRFWHTEAGNVSGSMTGKHTVRALRLDEFDLHHSGACLVDTRHAAARERLEGEQRHGGGAMILSRG